MRKLAFALIVFGTLYAPYELTRCIVRDMPSVSYTMIVDSHVEVIAIWFGYIAAMAVLALALFRSRTRVTKEN